KLANPKSADSRCAFVKKLFELSHWYFDNGQYLQSIAMLRELIVTIVCIRLEKDFFKLDANRRIAESYLNDKPNRNKEDDATTKYIEAEKFDWKDTGLPESVKALWDPVSGLRNDVLHCGFNENSQKAERIISKNKEFLDELAELFESEFPNDCFVKKGDLCNTCRKSDQSAQQ
ncbi:MAG: hypothetical protein ACK5NT_12445, partial [Pyrinomonadaceae bacterium]